MEKKKILKIIMLVLAVILLIFIISTTRKVIILTSLKNKASVYEQSSDIHIKTQNERMSVETYISKDKYKTILQSEEKNVKITQITDYNKKEGRTYYDTKSGKVVEIKKEKDYEFLGVTPIYTFANSNTLIETIYNAISSKIYTEIIDGEEYYVIEGKKNTNFALVTYEENTTITDIKGYISKKTGLRTKMVTTIKDENEKRDKITTYQYSFDKLTEEDWKEPSMEEYSMI